MINKFSLSLGSRKSARNTTSSEQHCYAGFEFELKRSSRRRRTLSLFVGAQGKIKVMVPRSTPIADVHNLIEKKQGWLKGQLQHRSENKPPTISGEAGDKFPFLGQTLTLQLISSKANKITVLGSELLFEYLGEPPSNEVVKNKIKTWLCHQADCHLPQIVARWAPVMGQEPSSVLVKQYKARWGSCSKNGAIALNWKLICAPRQVIDYVVVHELAHLVHFNHSSNFWALVKLHMPNYKQHKKWLSTRGGAESIPILK